MKCEGRYILKELERVYTTNPSDYIAYDVWLKTKDPFKVLIATILSQNSTDRGAYKAYYNLEGNIGISLDKLAKADMLNVAKAIRNIGLYNSKAKRIIELSNIILDKYGDLNNILNQEDKARNILMSLPGVGEKTADVVLLTCKGYPVFPVDTHIKRVSLRLGIDGKNYESISRNLMKIFPKDSYLKAHHLLIAHGRLTCKAKNPLCEKCTINNCCEYYSRVVKSKRSHST
ncbi:endonuclease III [Candidatus Acidianus copahuensis]|uniref:thymine-DNA glycosylase n=1 Tax=Candidatus Acidianus copahuensis TaxID=1160895 RepID=A0A031LMS5_9CREN|nr:endonuclease III [Candidatus Acidianus copahuensis]EZQ03195.1 2-hydroxyacid dehydrogenase [Candidatus Acidianus copahuensis]NON61975.1 endonuclease III [Acidianus sp. RZ1]